MTTTIAAIVSSGTGTKITPETLLPGTNVTIDDTGTSITINATGSSGITQLTGDVTAGPGSGSQAATIPNDTVTYAKIQNVSATDRILGRSSVGAGDIEEITCTSFARTILDDADAAAVRATIGAGTGNGTVTSVSGTAPIASSGGTTPAISLNDNGVSNTKLADMATATFKGRTTAGTGDPEDLTATQATALLDAFTSALKGLAPASGGGTTNFLRADGSWAAPTAAAASTNPNLYVTTADYNLSSNYSLCFPAEYEVGSGFVTDVASDAILEVC